MEMTIRVLPEELIQKFISKVDLYRLLSLDRKVA